MKDYELKDIDPDEISDILVKVEKSFHIKFGNTDLKHILTFGHLCDQIASKIQLDKLEDCSNQQAFYKLRNIISSILQIEKNTISTNFPLDKILPKRIRRSRIKKIEKELNFKLNMLRPPHWVTGVLMSILLASIIVLFFNWQIGLLGLMFFVFVYWTASKLGNELDLQTVGQVAEKMTRENYLKSRRNPKTFNKNEIEKILTDWFSDELSLDKSKLTRNSTFRT